MTDAAVRPASLPVPRLIPAVSPVYAPVQAGHCESTMTGKEQYMYTCVHLGFRAEHARRSLLAKWPLICALLMMVMLTADASAHTAR